ncbi:MAG: hypothetical protein HYV27_00015 [Candidatus Hydrogenedentes bacterium]|nr:hypothetical protein [Candidatus Hydrogenedentota bacterium]
MAGLLGIPTTSVQGSTQPRATARGTGGATSAPEGALRPLPVDGPAAVVSFSPESLVRSQAAQTEREEGTQEATELTEEEQQEVQQLKQRDREVRQHEQAHVAAAGQYAQGGPQFEFTRGPDGQQYATGGHVGIDVSAESTPEASIAKARVVRRAALAPAEPSPADRAVAAAASKLEIEARNQIRERERQEVEALRAGQSAIRTATPTAVEAFKPGTGGTAGPSRLDLFA